MADPGRYTAPVLPHDLGACARIGRRRVPQLLLLQSLEQNCLFSQVRVSRQVATRLERHVENQSSEISRFVPAETCAVTSTRRHRSKRERVDPDVLK